MAIKLVKKSINGSGCYEAKRSNLTTYKISDLNSYTGIQNDTWSQIINASELKPYTYIFLPVHVYDTNRIAYFYMIFLSANGTTITTHNLGWAYDQVEFDLGSANNVKDVILTNYDQWVPITWNGESPGTIWAMYLWTDGRNLYFSRDSRQYKYNKLTNTWETVSWNVGNIDGSQVWNDGSDVYYLYYSSAGAGTRNSYKLNKSTNMWESITFLPNTLDNIFGGNVVVINGTSYNLGANANYKLNKSTLTWEQFYTWRNVNFVTHSVWTDGEKYYATGLPSITASSGTTYELVGDEWVSKTWNGFNPKSGFDVWTDGHNMYYSYGNDQYILDKSTSTWIPITWTGLTSFNGEEIFLFDGTVYFYNGSNAYELLRDVKYLYKDNTIQWVKPCSITIEIKGYSSQQNVPLIIFRKSNYKAEEPSASYSNTGESSSYVYNGYTYNASGTVITGFYGDTLYVKAGQYSSGNYTYNVAAQSYTVEGDGNLEINVNRIGTGCNVSCTTSVKVNKCGSRCDKAEAAIAACGDNSSFSNMCLN